MKIATGMFAEALENLQHSMWLVPESRRHTVKHCCLYLPLFVISPTIGLQQPSILLFFQLSFHFHIRSAAYILRN
jgi:hypothetical protein